MPHAHANQAIPTASPPVTPGGKSVKGAGGSHSFSSTWWAILKLAFANFFAHKISRLGAALSYYTVFSLAPLLVLAVAMASLVFGQEAVNNQLSEQMQGMLGPQAAEAIQTMIASARASEGGAIATFLGLLLLFFGASGVFVELQDAINTVWEVPPKNSSGISAMLRDRGLSFAMVIVIGFLLLVSLVVNTAIVALQKAYGDLVPGLDLVIYLVNTIASLAIVTVLFALIFKFLPDVKVAWRDVWVGAFVSAVLFSIGKFAIGCYLGQGAVSSTYGAAASLAVILIWTYYSSQILLLGAELTLQSCRSRRPIGVMSSIAVK